MHTHTHIHFRLILLLETVAIRILQFLSPRSPMWEILNTQTHCPDATLKMQQLKTEKNGWFVDL